MTWNSTQDGSSDGIYAQRFSSAGSPLGSEFQINTYTFSSQALPAIAFSPVSGDFVVTWISYEQDGNSSGIYARRYNSSGAAQSGEFQVNTYTTGLQTLPAIAFSPISGEFVVTWMSSGQDGSNNGIYAQRYDSSGVAQGGEFQVNTYTTDSQSLPAIAYSPSGEFVVTWNSVGQDGNANGIYAQRFSSTGSRMGSEFQVNTFTTSFQISPAIAYSPSGEFVVAWASNQDGSLDGIYAQRFSSTGSLIGSEFQVNTTTTDAQTVPAIAFNSSNEFVVTWESNGQDQSGFGVYAQRFGLAAPNTAPTLSNIGDQILNEDGSTGTLNFTVNDAETPASSLNVTATSTNLTLVPSSNLVLGGSGTSRTLVVTPAANQSGTLLLTVEVSDGSVTTTQTFLLTVNPVADTPSVTNATTNEDNQTTSGLVISRNAVDGAEVTHFKITNLTNGTLFLNDGVTPVANNSFLTFAQANAGLKFTPTPNFFGTGSFDVQASINNTDAGLGGSVVTANITVNAVNDPPSFVVGTNPNVNEDAGAQTVNSFLTSIAPGPNETGQTVAFNVTNNNNALFSIQPSINAAGALTYTPAPNAFGSATVTITAQDNGSTANGGIDTSAPQTFLLTVNPVNDAPSFAFPLTTIESREDAGLQTFAAFATGIVAGPDNESSQTLTFNLTANTNPGLFSAPPAIGAGGTLTDTSAPDASGMATVTFVLQDNGGTANGGVDTSASQTVTITVIPQPRVSAIASDPQATEVGFDNGRFRLELDKPADEDFTLVYTLGGTASNGTDHVFLNTTVFVTTGSTFVEIPVVARADRAVEGTETVILSLQPGTGYNLGTITTAQVGILDFVFDTPNTPGNGVLSRSSLNGDIILGNNNANRIAGTDLNDTIAAFAGDDVVFGFGGNDSIDGGLGNDTLNGGAGDDTLIGSVGDNTLSGDVGIDVFVLRTTGSFDVITDFADGIDRIRTAPATTLGTSVGAGFLNTTQNGTDTLLSVNGVNIARLVNFNAGNFSGADLI